MSDTLSEQRGRRDRTCIFIDNTNLLHAVRTLAVQGQRIDYFFLKEYLSKGRSADARFYYSTTPEQDQEVRVEWLERYKKFLSSIEEFGYTVIGVNSFSQAQDGLIKEDGLELEIAYDMAKFSQLEYSTFILVANDDVYARLVKRLRRDGMEVDVAFFGLPSCCTMLSRVASRYHDLSKVSDRLFRRKRPPSHNGLVAVR